MNLQETIQKIQENQKAIDELNRETRKLKESLIMITPFKRGDKVTVIQSIQNWHDKVKKEIKTICFVSSAEYSTFEPYYQYRFNKMKKDGTMGDHGASIYSYDKIEKL